MNIHSHLVPHVRHPTLKTDSTLHVIGVLSNPVRFNSRLRLFRHWHQEMLKTPHIRLYLVEIAYGDRQFEVTEEGHPDHLQLRATQELWHKENMINLGVRHLLPKDWRYLAWLDTDIHFHNSGWALETLHQLQTYPVIQPWSECLDLGFHGNVMQLFQSFCKVHRDGVPKQTHPCQPYKYAHSGFAWACRREFWENVRGLMDWCIVGSADHHQAWAMIGRIQDSVHGKMSEGFKRAAREWQDRACRITRGDELGYVKGAISHHFHGPKARRQYRERWQIFIEHQFNPYSDLIYDSQGLVKLLNHPKLEAEIRSYNRGRHEDSIEDS